MTPHPLTFATLPDEIRGYRLDGLIGAGAMGAVYRALARGDRRGLAAGTPVALKILDPRFAPDVDVVRRFKREAGIGLDAIHPGIARVHEIGSLRIDRGNRGRDGGGERRLHYIVQELLRGGSLQARLESEGPQPEPVIRELARQVAEALAFVHGRAIVHRDLKPANLFLDERGHVKIVDFGLARVLGEAEGETAARERAAGRAERGERAAADVDVASGITSAGRFLGTVAYAAPEQLAGAPATPRSDLFSLGLILFEMATGAHPFAHEREQGYDAYANALQSRDAPALTDLRADVSYFLERIVQLLLERDPRHRFESARAVADALIAGERSDFWRSAAAADSPLVSPGRRRLAVRRATRVVGRSHESALLADEARVAFAGRGRKVVIEGETGCGKTRLVDALADRLERGGPKAYFLVLRGRSGAAPLAPFADLLADAFALDECADAAARAERARQRAQELLGSDPAAAEATEAIVELLSGRGRRGALPAARTALVALLIAVARQAPLLLVADALERADLDTLRALVELEARVADHRLLLVATLRRQAHLPKSAAAIVGALERGATRFELGTLDEAAFEPIARDLALESDDLARLARRLRDLSCGLPGVALELHDWLAARGELAALQGRRVAITSLPPSFDERFTERLAPLDPSEHALVETAAVLGADVRMNALREILGLEPHAFEPLIARLEGERRLLARRSGLLRFRDPLLRRWIVARTPLERRREVHRVAARRYDREASQAAAPPRAALKAAIHADLSGERPILARHLPAAVRLLELEGMHERAERLLASAIRAGHRRPEEPRLLAEALVLKGQLAHHRGRRSAERATWTEAIRLGTQLNDPALLAQAWHGLGRLASRTGRFVTAENALRQAEQAAQRAPRGPGGERALILLDLAEALLWSGDEERCARALGDAEQAIDAGASPASIARYFKERGNLLLELERFDEAADAFRQGRELVRGAGQRALHRALVIGHARLLRELADWDRARKAAEVARRSAESDLDRRHLAQAWFVLGDVASRAGDPDGAFVPYVTALRLARRISDDYLVVSCLAALSFLYRWKRFRRHSLRRSARCARRAIALARDLDNGRLEARGLAALALCYRDMGRLTWARAIAEKAVREAQAAGIRRRRAAEIWYVHGLILHELGRTDEARASLFEARRRLERRLLGVASAATRARMVERDPLLREIEQTRA
jgi:serine/threonine protein kinase/tetratricopeptide (TPR) repeat protein